ncbi:MAG: helix-turn-helix domain-containing protein [Myxococcota bacterium]
MYREHAPVRALQPFVQCYWTKVGAGLGPQRVLPDGCLDVLVDARRGTARVIGAMTRASVADGELLDLVGVRFRPGEAPALLGGSAAEHTDAAPDLALVWGTAAAAALAEPIAEATGAARLAHLEAQLLRRLGERWADWRVRRAVGLLEGGGASIAAVAAAVGLGERQLERLFRERVGLSPKRFARIARVQRAVAAPAGLAEVAVRHGFADASHVVREFRALCGVTPGALWGAG